MTKIRYIGAKPAKFDNVADTGLTWNGAGDVHEVTDPAKASKLLAHSLIWDEPSADAKQPKSESAPDPSTALPAGTTDPKAVDPSALHARATELGIAFKGNWGVPRLTKAIADAEAKAASTALPAGTTDPQA